MKRFWLILIVSFAAMIAAGSGFSQKKITASTSKAPTVTGPEFMKREFLGNVYTELQKGDASIEIDKDARKRLELETGTWAQKVFAEDPKAVEKATDRASQFGILLRASAEKGPDGKLRLSKKNVEVALGRFCPVFPFC